ncbi:TonB-dependent siderophore receptor [Rhizobium sp. SL86]|uniref:TonB-dependent siderophore receptor n=1 Tax=Rhizobium sp. SL86 TaxID=2995148 RepID=UPI002275580A|nr:TonB-dependent siderophore receptor [Rhizobium sp. SL86]MCY1666304.1 TonB-dependent siderophore receptor [Rhizobium sp. SL86]
MASKTKLDMRRWFNTSGLLGLTLLFGLSATEARSNGVIATDPVSVSIPADTLESGILSFGRQANIRLLYPTAITRGKTTAGVSGQLSAEAALRQLLGGSGLSYSFASPGTVQIFDPVAATVSQTVGSTVLAPVLIEGEFEGAAGIVATDGYVGKSGRTATKTDTPVAETPMSVSTVSQKQLQDIKPQNLSEAVNYTPGARIGQYGAEPRFDAFKVRGIDLSTTGIFRDGLRQVSSQNGSARLEPYGVEAVTMLRGPAASLYGASSSSGIVDIISKRPTEETIREVELQYGSFGRVQGAFDLSGTVNDDTTMLYRLTGVARDGRNEISAIQDDRLFIAPAFTWQPDDGTRLTFLGEYMDSTTGGTWGYINNYGSDGKSVGAIPVYGGDARFNDFRQQQWRVGYEFEHALTDTVTLYSKARYSGLSADQQWVFANYPGITIEDNEGLSADTYLKIAFETGAASHTLLTGVDFSHMSYTSRQGSGPGLFTDSFTYVPDVSLVLKQRMNTVGLYAQDQIEIGGWRLTVGVRHDWLDTEYQAQTVGATSAPVYDGDDTKTTGRLGLGYVFDNGIMPYASYGTSFVANPGVIITTGTVTGQAEPTVGKQYEIGVKYALPDHNAMISAAVFNIDQENATVYETSSGINLLRQLDLRSRGIELAATASLDNGWSVIAGYSYNRVEITTLTPETLGNQLNSSPYHVASLWLDHEFQNNTLEGLGIGAGIRYVGSSFGDNVHTPILDNEARTFVDATLRYDLGKVNRSFAGIKLQVNATNLLNEVKQVCTTGFCYYDEGRKVVASLKYRF